MKRRASHSVVVLCVLSATCQKLRGLSYLELRKRQKRLEERGEPIMFEVAADSCWTLAQQSHSQWECVSQHLFLHALHDRYREESLCDWRWNPLSGQYAQPRLGRFSTWCGLLSTALLRRLEVRVRAPADYRFNPHAAGPWQQQLGAHNQGSVNGKMRAILIDWLVRRFGGSIKRPAQQISLASRFRHSRSPAARVPRARRPRGRAPRRRPGTRAARSRSSRPR